MHRSLTLNSSTLTAALLAGRNSSEARVAAGVSSFLSSSLVAQTDELNNLYTISASHGGLSIPFARASASTSDALPFLRAVRACARNVGAGIGGSHHHVKPPAWATAADAAAISVLTPLYSPTLTRVVKLRAESEVEAANGQGGDDAVAQASLVAAARKGETVRPTSDASDWARKFGSRRIAFSLVHVAAPAEPLAFLFSALAMKTPSGFRELDSSSGALLPSGRSWQLSDRSRSSVVDEHPSSAIFYSVSTVAAHSKLRLGQRLLFDGASQLATALPSLRNFSTLSPVPGFSAWLAGVTRVSGGDTRDALERALNSDVAVNQNGGSNHASGGGDGNGKRRGEGGNTLAAAAAAALVPWTINAAAAARATPAARALTAAALRHYLLAAGGAKPLCPVATFHLGNGASLARLCGAADESPEGGSRSGGFCVNYEYSRDGGEGLARARLDGMEAWSRARDAGSMEVLKSQDPSVIWGPGA